MKLLSAIVLATSLFGSAHATELKDPSVSLTLKETEQKYISGRYRTFYKRRWSSCATTYYSTYSGRRRCSSGYKTYPTREYVSGGYVQREVLNLDSSLTGQEEDIYNYMRQDSKIEGCLESTMRAISEQAQSDEVVELASKLSELYDGREVNLRVDHTVSSEGHKPKMLVRRLLEVGLKKVGKSGFKTIDKISIDNQKILNSESSCNSNKKIEDAVILVLNRLIIEKQAKDRKEEIEKQQEQDSKELLQQFSELDGPVGPKSA
jgi:hypothetical protein